MTSIQWTDKTWNPTTGCTKVSAGCRNCYAESIAKRFWGERKFSDVEFHEDRLDAPLKLKKPTKVFVNSMGDLFHDDVTDEQLDKVFAVMALAHWHTFQVLTKVPERMLEYSKTAKQRIRREIVDLSRKLNRDAELFESCQWDYPLPNVWLGVSVENQQAANERIPLLLKTPATIRFLSCEPLLEKVDISEFLNYAVRQAPRRNNLPSSSVRGVRNRQSRTNMEDSEEGLGQVESMRSPEQMQASKSGIDEGGLFNYQGDVRQQEIFDGRTPINLSAFLRGNSECNGNQPQGRQQEKQPPTESGNNDTTGEHEAFDSCSETREYIEPVGRKQPFSETNKRTSAGDCREERTGRAIKGNSKRLRNNISDSIKNCTEAEQNQGFWVIVGGESGPSARPCHVEWIRSIVQQCQQSEIPVFVKQLGNKPIISKTYISGVANVHHYLKLNDAKGGDINEFPEDLRIREFPI